MNIPTRSEAQALLETHVQDEYQRHHARMVATAMEGYARMFNEAEEVWYLTGLLHDLDFEKYPDHHPAQSLEWFKGWGYPEEILHAVEAHAYGYNGFTTLPETKLASALMACDELCGIFYAYQKLNPRPLKEIKASSIRKKFDEKTFAAKIDRDVVRRGCELLGVEIDQHIANLLSFLQKLD